MNGGIVSSIGYFEGFDMFVNAISNKNEPFRSAVRQKMLYTCIEQGNVAGSLCMVKALNPSDGSWYPCLQLF
jgi:hypothetical protein